MITDKNQLKHYNNETMKRENVFNINIAAVGRLMRLTKLLVKGPECSVGVHAIL